MKLTLSILGFLLAILNVTTTAWAESVLPVYAASPAAALAATGDNQVCESMEVVGQTRNIPIEVTFQVNPVLENVQGYRYSFGDGVQREFGADGGQYTHTYRFPQEFEALVELKNAQGQWVTENACEVVVEVPASNLVAARTACQGIEINDTPVGYSNLSLKTGKSIKFTVLGLDTRQPLGAYRLELGNGEVVEQTGNVFIATYDTPGSYAVRASVRPQNSDQWISDASLCSRQISVAGEEIAISPTVTPVKQATISSTLTTQPQTGASTEMLVGAIAMVSVGMVLMIFSLRQKEA